MSSSSETVALCNESIDELRRICATLEVATLSDQADHIPDEVVTSLLSAATAVFAKLSHDRKRQIPALHQSDAVTATAVVVTVSAMLRAADLSSFDLAMWFNRPSEFPA